MDPQGAFCPNERCPARGKVGKGNIRVHSHKERRYRCWECGKTFVERRTTALYRLHKPTVVVIQVVTLLAYGCPVQAIVPLEAEAALAAFGLDERTVRAWQLRAGVHCQGVHQALVQQPRDLQHVQADEIRVKGQGRVVWIALALMVRTRLWLGGVVSAKRNEDLIEALVQQVRRCALCRPLLVCVDGFAAYVSALQAGFRSPLPSQTPGRPQLVVWPVLLIAQVVKHTQGKRLVEVVRRMARGPLQQALELLGQSGGGVVLNTAYIERLNATFRSHLAPLMRRSRAPSRQLQTLHAGMFLVGCVYNFCTYHRSLRQPLFLLHHIHWVQRTPAMAAAITDRCWSVAELLSYRIPPPPWSPPRRRGRPSLATQRLLLRYA